MNDLPGIAVAGACGRMGRMLVTTVEQSDHVWLSGATERAGHEWLGRDLADCGIATRRGTVVREDILDVLGQTRAILDFTTPASSVRLAGLAAQARCVHVIGTTGLTADDLERIAAAARHTVIIRSDNMSMGINLLKRLVSIVAHSLDEDFDIEILESHHRHKVDAPSGTALMLGHTAAASRGRTLEELADRGRDGITGPRRRGMIGFSAVRGGEIVGEHDVIFIGSGERLALRHVATDRTIYASGALKAALWGIGKAPGEYSMDDVLSLT